MAAHRRVMKRGVLLLGTIMMIMMSMMQQGVMAAENEEDADEEAAALSQNLAVIEMKVRNLYPEGFDWDAKHNRFLVGSMRQGGLVTVTEEGVVEEFIKDEEYAGASILGVRVDSIRNRVLAAVFKYTDPPLSALAAYDLDSKKRTLFVDLLEEDDRVSKKVVANDVAVDGAGNAYVTNSGGNLIWKVTPDGVKSVFVGSIPQLPIAAEDEFAKKSSSNGIVHHDGYLLVSQSNSGALFRVGLADAEVQVVRINDGEVLPAADGMALRSDGSLVVVSTHTAWLLSSRDSWQSATLVDKVPLDEAGSTTSGTTKDLRVFTIHSYFPDHFKGVDRDLFKILEIKFTGDDSDDNNPLWLLAIVGMFAAGVLLWKVQVNRFNTSYTKKRI